MEQNTDLVIDDCFVMHVLDNRLPTVQSSQELTPLPDSFRGVLTKYLLSLLRPTFQRKRFGRFRPEASVLHEYRRLMASAGPHERVNPAVFLEASQRLASLLFAAMRRAPENGMHARRGEITPGDLLVGLFYGRMPQASPVPYLFLIKVDL